MDLKALVHKGPAHTDVRLQLRQFVLDGLHTQMDTNTVTGVSGSTNGYKYCHRSVWKHKRVQIPSQECLETQMDTNAVTGVSGGRK